jgi:hypothetical protein
MTLSKKYVWVGAAKYEFGLFPILPYGNRRKGANWLSKGKRG